MNPLQWHAECSYAAMSLRRPSLLAVPFLGLVSLVVACGGSIESGSEKELFENGPGGSSGSSGGDGSSGGGSARCRAAPSCDPGDRVLAGKSGCAFSENCYERTVCDETIRCARSESQCAAYPSCKDGYVEVPASSCKTKDCVTETLCGATIFCKPDAQCDGYPSCDSGHKPVKSPSECLQDDAACYPRTLCGVTIWCTGPLAGDAGAPRFPPPP